MDWIPVSSSRMRAVCYDAPNRCLYIRFNNGSIYCYSNVSESDFEAFMSAPSLGHELVNFQQFHPYRRVQ